MKALILAAGRGKRLGELTQEKNKCLMEIGGRPLLSYSLDCASKIPQITEIVIVVGWQAEEIVNLIGDHYQGKPVKYVFQQEQGGLVHAIEQSKDVLGGADFLLMLGDELMTNPRHLEMMQIFEDKSIFAICGILLVEDKNLIKKTYSISQDKAGNIIKLIEKPQDPPNNIMGTGNCVFRNEIFSYIEKTPVNPNRNEKELPDLIQAAIDDGKIIKPLNLCNRYFNFNIKEEIHDVKSFFAHFSEEERNLL